MPLTAAIPHRGAVCQTCLISAVRSSGSDGSTSTGAIETVTLSGVVTDRGGTPVAAYAASIQDTDQRTVFEWAEAGPLEPGSFMNGPG